MLHPDWSVRLEGVARVPLTTASYALDGVPLQDYVSQRRDHFATIGGSLGLAKTF